MFKKRSSRANDSVPRRRRAVEDEQPETPVTGNQYRRNQTLSGYRAAAPEGESSRHKVHALARQRRRLSGIFLIVAAAVVLLTLLLWQLMAQVQITTSTKQLEAQFQPAPYEQAINEYLGLNPAQRLRFALDEQALSDYVSSELPEVEKLEMSTSPGLARGGFTITFRTPVAGWQINDSQYYVDTTGVVFEKNYYAKPTVQIVDESGIDPEQGSAVVGGRLLGFLGKVVAQAGERGYTVVQAVLPQDTTRELDVYFDGVGTRIKLSIDRGAGEQLEDADRSLKYLQARGVGAQYIDVRVSGRAAYR